MAKVVVVTAQRAQPVGIPDGFSGNSRARAYLAGDSARLQLHQHTIPVQGHLKVGPMSSDCLLHVWQGTAATGGHCLASGSTVIVERGASAILGAEGGPAEVLAFVAASPPANPRAGGSVHILPEGHAPRLRGLDEAQGVGGALHADGSCPTCELWLHENEFQARSIAAGEDMELGIHSHTEDEIIFVTGGTMRLGGQEIGPGTAIAIAADTFYGFGIGAEGLQFVNFRAATPGPIHFKDSPVVVDEAAFWRGKLGSPAYLAPL